MKKKKKWKLLKSKLAQKLNLSNSREKEKTEMYSFSKEIPISITCQLLKYAKKVSEKFLLVALLN